MPTYTRYYESLENLNLVIDICDEINIYDNTNKLNQILYIKNGILNWKEKKLPNWILYINMMRNYNIL